MDEDTRRKVPPRWPKSEYDKLCDELGGAADIGVALKKPDFRSYCDEYPLGKVLPILLRFANENSARRHWPWTAMAISLYKSETDTWAHYADEPSPKQIRELLMQIERGARDLRSGLSNLQELSNRLPDPSSPLRRPHLSWLDEFIWQTIAGQISMKCPLTRLPSLRLKGKSRRSLRTSHKPRQLPSLPQSGLMWGCLNGSVVNRFERFGSLFFVAARFGRA